MRMTLGHEEPEFSPWQAVPLSNLVALLSGAAGASHPRPSIVAIDGRSSSGKTTLAGRVSRAVRDCYVVHTDDIAWKYSRFGWSELIVSGVLEQVHRGDSVSFRPPAWDVHHRPGSIDIPLEAALVIIEGVGSSRLELSDWIDVGVWVQADLFDVERRNAERVRSGETSEVGVAAWMAEEFPFIEQDRSWERAHVVVAGSAVASHDRDKEVIIAARHAASVATADRLSRL
jgi:hypothetical protein